MLQIHGNNKESSSSSLNVAHGTYTYPSDRKGIEQPHAEIMKQQGLDSTQHKARQGKAWHSMARKGTDGKDGNDGRQGYEDSQAEEDLARMKTKMENVYGSVSQLPRVYVCGSVKGRQGYCARGQDGCLTALPYHSVPCLALVLMMITEMRRDRSELN